MRAEPVGVEWGMTCPRCGTTDVAVNTPAEVVGFGLDVELVAQLVTETEAATGVPIELLWLCLGCSAVGWLSGFDAEGSRRPDGARKRSGTPAGRRPPRRRPRKHHRR